MASTRTNRPFPEELPRLLQERGLSLRSLGERVGVTGAHLSRVVRGVNYKSVSGDLAGRVALALDLPRDYFPEYREGVVVERVRRDSAYRDRLYDLLGKSKQLLRSPTEQQQA